MHDPAVRGPGRSLPRSEAALQANPHASYPVDYRPDARIVRYTANERTLHWALAIAFFLAGLSGMALFHPALFGLSGLFGGGQWTRVLHPFFGIAMVLFFFLFAIVARLTADNRITADDRRWLTQIGDVVTNREDRLPRMGRYNAGQKMLYWVLILVLLTLLVTGFLFWRPWFAHYFPIGVIRIATLLHAYAAALLVVLMVVHIYSAFWVKGSIRAMVQGWVSQRWAHRHHPMWLQRMLGRSRLR